MNAQIEVKHLLPAWERFRVATGIAPIRNRAHYRRMVKTLKALLDAAAGNESHPALPPATGVHALKFLMEQHGLKQGDLPELRSQGVVSEIPAGKRELNVRQIRAPAERFSVAPATFI